MNDVPALKMTDLRFRYSPNEAWVIDVPAFSLARNEQTLLTGGSGRGKSTLLHIIAGLVDPVEGHVLIHGDDIHSLHGAKRDALRGARIGMIFQTFNLLHGFSALENVMIAMMFSNIPRKEHARRASALLDQLEVERASANPDELSVGQQQRVAVARALACDPALVLADEPTASLDPENASRAISLIQEACAQRGAALLCVSHDPAMTERFERHVSLDELAGAPGISSTHTEEAR